MTTETKTLPAVLTETMRRDAERMRDKLERDVARDTDLLDALADGGEIRLLFGRRWAETPEVIQIEAVEVYRGDTWVGRVRYWRDERPSARVGTKSTAEDIVNSRRTQALAIVTAIDPLAYAMRRAEADVESQAERLNQLLAERDAAQAMQDREEAMRVAWEAFVEEHGLLEPTEDRLSFDSVERKLRNLALTYQRGILDADYVKSHSAMIRHTANTLTKYIAHRDELAAKISS